MEILDIKVLRGPNYWSSNRKKLIEMRLDLKEYEYLPTNLIEGFGESLEQLLPSLINHRCSEEVEGGFFERVKDGTWLGHVVEHVALELQTLAEMDCGFGRTRSTKNIGVYHVVFSYKVEKAGIYAAKAAVNLVESLISKMGFNLEAVLLELQQLYNNEKLGPTTLSIVNEAQRRNIPYNRLNNDSLIMLGQGKNQKIICASVAASTSNLAVELASDKDATRTLLSHSHIPVPKGKLINNINEMEEVVKDIGFPLVTKPVNGNHGRGITTRISTLDQAINGFFTRKKFQTM
jgi:cyanophycin synthetase